MKIGRDMAFAGYPACNFYLTGVGSDAVDNQPKDYRTYRFAINIVQQVSQRTRSQDEVDFEEAVDAVLDKLNVKWQLQDGSSVPTADNTTIEPGTVQQIETQAGPAVILTILLAVKTLIY